MTRKMKFGTGGYNEMFANRSLAEKGPGTPVVQDISNIDQSADKAANAALAARQAKPKPAARPVIAQAAAAATPSPDTRSGADRAASAQAHSARATELATLAQNKAAEAKRKFAEAANYRQIAGGSKPATSAPTKTAPSKGTGGVSDTGSDHSRAAIRERADRKIGDPLRAVGKAAAAALIPGYGAYKAAQAGTRASGRNSQRKPTSTLPDSSKQELPAAFKNANRGPNYIYKKAKGGRIKMATGGDTNFESDAKSINESAADAIKGSHAVVQDTSKMDTSADDAANARLKARSSGSKTATPTRGGKPPDNKAAMGKSARSFRPDTPAPAKKPSPPSSSSSPPDRLSAYRSAAAARGASAPETKGSDITVTAPRGTRAANAAASTQKRKLAEANTRASGYYAQGRTNVAKAQGMSERDKTQAAHKKVFGYAKGGTTTAAPPKQSGMAKAANSSLGRETLNPAKAVARGNREPVEKMPPKGAASTSRYAKGGSIDGCAKRGHTRAKRSR